MKGGRRRGRRMSEKEELTRGREGRRKEEGQGREELRGKQREKEEGKRRNAN